MPQYSTASITVPQCSIPQSSITQSSGSQSSVPQYSGNQTKARSLVSKSTHVYYSSICTFALRRRCQKVREGNPTGQIIQGQKWAFPPFIFVLYHTKCPASIFTAPPITSIIAPTHPVSPIAADSRLKFPLLGAQRLPLWRKATERSEKIHQF